MDINSEKLNEHYMLLRFSMPTSIAQNLAKIFHLARKRSSKSKNCESRINFFSTANRHSHQRCWTIIVANRVQFYYTFFHPFIFSWKFPLKKKTNIGIATPQSENHPLPTFHSSALNLHTYSKIFKFIQFFNFFFILCNNI